MIDKKQVKEAYKLADKIGAVIAYQNKTKDKVYIDIATDIPSIKNRFEFAKKTGIGLPMTIQNDAKQDVFELTILEELKKIETQSDKEFKEDLLALKDIWLEKFESSRLY